MAKNFDPATLDLQEKLVALNRVSKTVKGGRIAASQRSWSSVTAMAT